MNEPSGVRRPLPIVGVVLLAVAGILLIVGAFVPAGTVDIQGQGSSSSSLWDQDWEGWAALVVGIVLLLGAAWALMSRPNLRVAGVIFAVLGIAATVLAVYKIVNIESEAIDRVAAEVAAQQGAPVDAVKPTIQQLFDSGAASASVSIGLWLVVIAGVIAVVAGIMLAMARPSQPMVTREPTQTQAPME
jgi:hypothetical protein